MCTWNESRHRKRLAWLLVSLVILITFGLFAATAHAQEASPTAGPYPSPQGPYPTPQGPYPTPQEPYPGPETATFVPAATSTQATNATAEVPIPTLQATATFPSSTSELAPTQPGLQSTQGLQSTDSGLQPTYIPFPTIYFQLPDESIPGANSLSQTQTFPTPVVAQGNSGVGRWVPLGVILVIWGLLAGWFYLSFRRLG